MPFRALLDRGAEPRQQLAELRLLPDLGRVVGRPVLRVRDLDRSSLRHGSVGLTLPSDGELDRVDGLAGLLPRFEIGAGAEPLAVHHDEVGAVPGLRGDLSTDAVPLARQRGGDLASLGLTCVRENPVVDS